MSRMVPAIGAVFFVATTALAQDFTLAWYTVDGGGGTFSTGGAFSLGGTIGQHDAGSFSAPMSGGSFTLVGGFWAGTGSLPCNGFQPCDTSCDGSINQFDIQPFVDVMIGAPACSPCAGDANGDGSLNQFDIQPFIECLSGP